MPLTGVEVTLPVMSRIRSDTVPFSGNEKLNTVVELNGFRGSFVPDREELAPSPYDQTILCLLAAHDPSRSTETMRYVKDFTNFERCRSSVQVAANPSTMMPLSGQPSSSHCR